MKTWQSYIGDVAIGAVDRAAEKIRSASAASDNVVHRLAADWGRLSDREKQEIAEVVVAVGTAAVVAAKLLKGGGKKKVKKIAKKVGKAAVKKVANSAVKRVTKNKK